jgi:hypothetical protein
MRNTYQDVYRRLGRHREDEASGEQSKAHLHNIRENSEQIKQPLFPDRHLMSRNRRLNGFILDAGCCSRFIPRYAQSFRAVVQGRGFRKFLAGPVGPATILLLGMVSEFGRVRITDGNNRESTQ